MAYICELSTGQTVYLDNQGSQTQLVVSLQSPGQQQQASSGFQTGTWLASPVAFQTPQGLVIKITAAQGESYIQVQGTSTSLMVGVPNTSGLAAIAMREGEIPHMATSGLNSMPMQPMQPMQGIKMGNMQMSMNPMQMKMGNMQMVMGNPPAAPPQRKFCSQCGGAIALSDRFCSSCGNSLQ